MNSALEDAFAKVVRTMHLHQAIADCLETYKTSNPCEVVAGKLKITNRPPREISLLTGEVLYQLRSALDHVFFELVRTNDSGKPLPPRWEQDSQFPLNARRPAGCDDEHVPKDKFNCRLRDWLSDDAFTFLESVQPYHRTNETGVNEHLGVLNKLSNTDKYRRLNTTIARVTRSETLTTPEGFTSSSSTVMLDTGADILPVFHHRELRKTAVHIREELEPRVIFDEPELGYGNLVPLEDVIYELPNACWWVVRHIGRFLK